MSSRNVRLGKEERKLAPFIYQTLVLASEKTSTLTPLQLKDWVTLQFKKQSGMELEYFEIVDDKGLMPIEAWSEKVNKVACIAVHLGGVRLIDNLNFD
jgi:pantoate--beta-alanine ligase